MFKKVAALLLSLLFATAVHAQPIKEQLESIDRGFEAFTEETFGGNGRTCATCHIAREAYNIFPATIAELEAAAAQGDAEAQAELDLIFLPHVPGLENEALVREHALFNISGGAGHCDATDVACFNRDLGTEEHHKNPIFRSSMTIQALDLTTLNPIVRPISPFGPPPWPGTPLLPFPCSAGLGIGDLPQLGWAGDGSPGTPNDVDDGSGGNVCNQHHGLEDPNADGSMRAFVDGAIAQHNTKSLDRTLGVDFRLATDQELDDLENFQRWLGRRELTPDENAIQATGGATEFNIRLLDFADDRVDLGRDHYAGAPLNGPPIAPPPPLAAVGAGCNGCHRDGGGTSFAGFNANFNTDVELASDDIGIAVLGAALPHDEGGFPNFGAPNRTGRLEAFNFQSVIEAAEKKAFFHNHKADDLEEALAHYFSDDFLDNHAVDSPEAIHRFGNGITISFPNGDGVEHVGAFLRSLNAFYNLRDCERLLDEAILRDSHGVPITNAIRHCRFNLKHVQHVLAQSKLRNLYTRVQSGVGRLYGQLTRIQNSGRYRISDLEGHKAAIRALRDSIAVQTSPAP